MALIFVVPIIKVGRLHRAVTRRGPTRLRAPLMSPRGHPRRGTIGSQVALVSRHPPSLGGLGEQEKRRRRERPERQRETDQRDGAFLETERIRP